MGFENGWSKLVLAAARTGWPATRPAARKIQEALTFVLGCPWIVISRVVSRIQGLVILLVTTHTP